MSEPEPTTIPYATPGHRGSSPAAVGGVLMLGGLGLIGLGGCFLIGILFSNTDANFYGTGSLSVAVIVFQAVLYLAAVGCFGGAIFLIVRAVRVLLPIPS